MIFIKHPPLGRARDETLITLWWLIQIIFISLRQEITLQEIT